MRPLLQYLPYPIFVLERALYSSSQSHCFVQRVGHCGHNVLDPISPELNEALLHCTGSLQ